MKEVSFEIGDRVRHKLTQIQGEIVQLEESLAMPHVWVIEPSVCDVNPPKLYRYVDLEKVEEQEDKQTLTEQLLEDKTKVFSPCNDSILNQLLENKKNDSILNQLLADNFPHTVSQPLPQRRMKGDGSGCIYWRTVVRNGKQYQQAYYQYEFWQNGQCWLKSTKYIPKKLLKQVLKLDRDKAPVLEILEVLRAFRK